MQVVYKRERRQAARLFKVSTIMANILNATFT